MAVIYERQVEVPLPVKVNEARRMRERKERGRERGGSEWEVGGGAKVAVACLT